MGFGSMRNTSNTKLLIHSDTTDASTTFADSASGHAITPAGNAQHSTTQKKWGKTGIKFDGTGDYISTPDHVDLQMGTGNFTIDFWTRFDDLSADRTFFSSTEVANPNDYVWFKYSGAPNPGACTFYLNEVNNSSMTLSAAWSPAINTWYHMALIRGWGGNANSWAITIDGKEHTSKTDTDSWPAEGLGDFLIGMGRLSSDPMYGYIVEFRIVKGEAMWTTNFIPPAGPYT